MHGKPAITCLKYYAYQIAPTSHCRHCSPPPLSKAALFSQFGSELLSEKLLLPIQKQNKNRTVQGNEETLDIR